MRLVVQLSSFKKRNWAMMFTRAVKKGYNLIHLHARLVDVV